MPAELTGAHRERLSPPGRCAPLTTRQRGEDPSFMSSMLWIGTRKGLFALRADGARRSWKLAGPQFLGHIIHHVVQDPRELRTLLMAAKTGHLGPTVFRSGDRGRSWREAAQPPAFRKALEGEEARAVQRVFWLTPGHRNETGTWYAGSSPAGLFRSSDGGERWEPVAGFNDNPMRPKWAAFPTPPGGCRWTARPCGRAPPSAASPPSTRPGTVARAGGVSIGGSRARRPGSRCCGRPCARTRTSGRAFISAPRPVKSGPAPTAGATGAASHGTCRRSTR